MLWTVSRGASEKPSKLRNKPNCCLTKTTHADNQNANAFLQKKWGTKKKINTDSKKENDNCSALYACNAIITHTNTTRITETAVIGYATNATTTQHKNNVNDTRSAQTAAPYFKGQFPIHFFFSTPLATSFTHTRTHAHRQQANERQRYPLAYM